MDLLSGGVGRLGGEHLEHAHTLPRRANSLVGEARMEVNAGLPVLSHGDTVAGVRLRIVLVTTAFAMCGLVAGCGSSSSGESNGRRDVVAAFYPLAFAAEQIGGKSVDVANLTPAGAEPHD